MHKSVQLETFYHNRLILKLLQCCFYLLTYLGTMILFSATLIILTTNGEAKKNTADRLKSPAIMNTEKFQSNSSLNLSTLSDSCYNVCDESFPCSDAFNNCQLIAAFSVQSTAACKMYCWYHKSCRSFTVNIQTSACGLYSAFPFIKNKELSKFDCNKTVTPTFDSVGVITCLQNLEKSPSVPCRTVKTLIKASQESGGVLIKDVVTSRCLGFGKMKDLKWKDCTLAVPWQLEEIDQETSNGKGIKIKNLRADSRNSCLTVTMTAMDRCLLTVLDCQERNASQVFQFTVGTRNNLSYMTDPKGNENTCFFAITSGEFTVWTDSSSGAVPLSLLRILLPSEHLALCQRNQLDLPYGMVQGKMPFYLPGSNVSVKCKPGYGFKKFNFESALNITCRNERTRAPKCVKVEAKPRDEFPLVSILVGGNSIQAIVIIYLGAWVFVLARKVRSLKADQSSAEKHEDLSNPSRKRGTE